jgi:type II secretory pathway pseudopilin PulG
MNVMREQVVADSQSTAANRRQGLALAGLLCGVVGLCLAPVGLAGLVMSVIALRRARRQPAVFGGGGLAAGGIVLGIVGVLLGLVLIVVVPWGLRLSHVALAMENLQMLGADIRTYANYHDGHFPPSLQDLIVDGSAVPETLINPNSGREPPACDYYYVTGLREDDPPDWMVAWEDPNQNGGEGACVLHVVGNVSYERTQSQGGQFEAKLRGFLKAYEAARGKPPVILPAE